MVNGAPDNNPNPNPDPPDSNLEPPEAEIQPVICLPSFEPPPMCHFPPEFHNRSLPIVTPLPSPTDYCSGPSIFLKECM